ncbi:PCP reductase family protein [Thiolapillus sp.]|uniref:PCP reductase family protein n=1 Tax=Thiolapillus sp. TaxID=2017437 RepID=UPI003AF7B345
MKRPDDRKPVGGTKPLAWTAEAVTWLEQLPDFLRDGIFTVAEDVARGEGRLEVNIRLLRRLEAGDSSEPGLPWEDSATTLLNELLAQRSPQAALFVRPTLQNAAEREARRRSAIVVACEDVEKVFSTDLAGVSWSTEALQRVESAPDFVRAGIKKAAEFNARREGIETIMPEDLTRFRNRAMMKAVRRMKGFGMQELDFSAFDIARNRVPRLKENTQAVKRFSEIRQYVESQQDPETGGLGLLDRELLDKMKAELKKR